jgi:hypothetical protein
MLVSLGSNKVDKSEALAVLHEILNECKETIVMTCVSLDSPHSHIISGAGGYKIKMKCELDSYTRKCLNPILQRHGLALEEKGEYATIFKPI